MKKKYSDILWISGGQILGLLSNFLLLKILTTYLSLSEYGYYTLFMATMLFVRQITYDSFSIIAAKEAATKNILDSSNYCILKVVRFAMDRLFMCLLVFIAVILIIIMVFIKRQNLEIFLVLGVIYLGSNGAQGVYINILNNLGERKWASIGIIFDSFLKLILIATFFSIFDHSVVVTIQAIAVSSFLVFLGTRYFSKRFCRLLPMDYHQRITAAKSLFILSLPFLAPSLLTALKGVGDKALMAFFIGVEELAAYNVLLQIGFIPMVLIVGIIQTYAGPHIYKLISKNSDLREAMPYIVKIVLRIFVFTTIAITVTSVLSDLVFGMLAGLEYLKYSQYLPYFVLAGALSGISSLLNIGVIGAFKSKIVGLIMLASVSTGLIIFVVSIAVFGFEGGVVGLIVSNLIISIFFGISLFLKRNYAG